MMRELEPAEPTVVALSRLTLAIGRIQAAATEEESLRLLGEAATELVAAERAVARLGALDSAAGSVTFPLVASNGETLGALEVVPRAGVDFGATEAALLRQLAQVGAWAIENGRLRQRLLEQDERLRLALEAASVGTWEHVPSTHATHWDERSKAIFGYGAADDLTFERYVSALHPDDKDGVFAGITKATDPDGKGECSLEYRIRLPSGAERWVEAHGRCVFENRVAQRIHGTLVDITSRKQAEDAIREAARRKDEFLAVLGHELRNPLAPIRTALDLMRLRYPDQGVREREVIERQVRHMMRLVDDLLDLARIARGAITLKREARELATVVEGAAEIASPLLEQNQHRLEIDVPAGLAVEIDPVRFTQVIANLLTNAAKFTPRGGHITVRGRLEADEVTLEVRDTGIGIEASDLESIFEPFVQANPHHGHSHGGLGLGLSLVRDLVNLHGGRVTAFSEGHGRGSCFVVYLPKGARRVPAALTPHAFKPRGAGRRILVVDDNQDATEMLAIVLTELGHVVRTAHDGPTALTVAAELDPEIAILDLGLPVMDGYELASRLLEAHGARGIRLMAITGYGQVEDRERTRAAGFHAHLVKPVDLKELQAALSPPPEK